MTIYLAAPWLYKDYAAVAKQRFIAVGITVVSTWTEREDSDAEIGSAEMTKQALADREDLRLADTLVILGLSKSDGKATEMGMALQAGKRVILVKADRRDNIFYHLPEVIRVNSLDDAIRLLKS